MENLTKSEAINLLSEVGHHASVSIRKKSGNKGVVLNNAMVYEPISNTQRGMSNNENNAERAVEMIMKHTVEFNVYSSVFTWATGDYKIVE